VHFGLDSLRNHGRLLARLRGAKVGVLAHAASVDRRLSHIVDVLAELDITPHTSFGPEHGFRGAAQDMISVDDATGGTTRVVSLYGDELEDLVPRAADLAPLDILLIDLCDVGSRYYTYVWTALLAARAAADVGVHTVVLDRGNPIGGAAVEGRIQQDGFTSFVGWEHVPIRHGLTLAEMVCLFVDKNALGPDGSVSVVAVDGWSRAALAPTWDRPFVLPSPNMPTFDTALVYPGGCLVEGTNFSEGRGHTRPFEFSGAPWIDGIQLAKDLAATGLGGFTARPASFIPTFHKHAGLVCGGVQIHVTDADLFRPVATYVAMIALWREQDPEQFVFRTERYEFVDDIPAFDLLTGSAETRLAMEAGEPPRDIAEAVSRVDDDWAERKQDAERRIAPASWSST
jgi:uncharacterized protein YbbC (DUF1343 family)